MPFGTHYLKFAKLPDDGLNLGAGLLLVEHLVLYVEDLSFSFYNEK